MTTFISAHHIAKTYGGFQAVRDVTFEVYSGEIFALLGPNGAGKSTTIRMILDIIKPDSGCIEVLGGPMTEAKKHRVGYLPEERGLYKSATVIELMTYLGKLKGLPGRDAGKKALALLEKLRLADFARMKVSELSKGMQQKVQFAVTVMHDPDLIIIDEPFSGLDPVNRIVIRDLLFEFRQRGGAVVMSTHQMNQVEEMADRLLMISHGEQKLYGAVADVRHQFALHAVVVEGQGDWGALPGVTRVEPHRNGRSGVMLYLAPEATTDSLLSAIAQSPHIQIERFERAVPSLDDIFIRVAGEARLS